MLSDIKYIEARGDYLKFYLESQKPILTKMTLKTLIEELPESFIQIHRSFVINQDKIMAYQKEKVKVGEDWLTISRSFKKDLNLGD
jgi:DNA-binding LytR/AlgR family response regulator